MAAWELQVRRPTAQVVGATPSAIRGLQEREPRVAEWIGRRALEGKEEEEGGGGGRVNVGKTR